MAGPMIRIACGVLLLFSSQGGGDAEETAPDIVTRIDYEVDLHKKHAYEPQTVAPDLFVRWGPDWSFGITHGHFGRGLVDSGGGLCAAGCGDRYRDGGLEARWRYLRAGLILGDAEPFKPQLLLGAGRAVRAGPVTFAADPYVRFGLANRDRGNRAFVNLPLWVEARWRGRVGGYLMTGVNSLLTDFSDYWSVPVALGAVAAPGAGFEVRAQVGFTRALGPLGTVQDRHLMLSVARRFRWPGAR